MKKTIPLLWLMLLISGLLVVTFTHAAVSLDRTRAIFNAGETSLSMTVTNQNRELPYLAQAWLEDEAGNKVSSPLALLPPLQRLEPGAKGQIKVQSHSSVSSLPQDRESVFYFNVREIPPRSDKPNSLQLALQTRIKLFYRPKALVRDAQQAPWQEEMTLTRQGEGYQVNNPTPYFITLVEVANDERSAGLPSFEPIMLAPKSSVRLKINGTQVGNAPVITYVNDYGARPKLQFTCQGATCRARSVKNSG